MFKNFLLIAQRYLQAKQKNNALVTMIKVCFLGICLATCALALVVSVMEGFEQATHQKMQSIYPDLIIDAHNQSIDMEALQPILKESEYHIKQYAEQKVGQALIYNHEHHTSPIVICLKGIQPHQEALVTNMHTKIIHPQKASLQKTLKKNKLLIGHKLAQNLNVSLDDNLQILFTNDEAESLHVTFNKKHTEVGGIFKTGIDEFDSNVVYCSSDFFDQLFPDLGVTQVHLALQNKTHEAQTIQRLKQRLHVDIYSWKELYPALVSALKLEKYAMFFILLLIVLIASMNIMSLIFMYITKKNKDIALLTCFGMSLRNIKIIFASISLIISFFATVVGLVLAYGIGRLLQIYPFITLPDDAYLVTHLPIQLDPVVFCVIFISSMLITLCATLISVHKMNDITIIPILKHE